MPRWLLPILAVSVLVLLAVAAKPILLPAGNPRLTRENFDRIKEGMSWEDVEVILGPPGDYRTGPTHYASGAGRWFAGAWPPTSEFDWKGDDGEIQVWVDREGVVLRSEFNPMDPDPIGLFDLLRWRWERWRESWQ